MRSCFPVLDALWVFTHEINLTHYLKHDSDCKSICLEPLLASRPGRHSEGMGEGIMCYNVQVRNCPALYYLFESLCRCGARTLCQDCCQTKFLSHNHLCMFLSFVLRECGVQGKRDMQCFDLFFFDLTKKPNLETHQ